MRLLSFNIRRDFEEDGPDGFAHRKEGILKMLAESRADVVCFQELLPPVAAWLRRNLRDYYLIGCGRDEQLGDEQVGIAFNPTRYQLCEFSTFWLSENEEIIASRFTEDQSRCPRACSEIVLHEPESGELYRIFNIHLDHAGPIARRRGLALILQRIRARRSFAQARLVLAGDFNCLPASPELEALRGEDWRDAGAELGGTFHDFGRQKPAEKIDYIFLSPGLKLRAAILLNRPEANAPFYSDHHPLLAEFETLKT